MTLRELIYDVKLIASKSGITDDHRLGVRHIAFLIQKQRAAVINIEYERLRVVDPAWIQNLGFVEFLPVEFSDDPNITTAGSQKMGKWVSPSILSIRNDVGFNRVSTVNRMAQYNIVSFARLMQIVETSVLAADPIMNPRAAMRHAARVGNQVYVWPLDQSCKDGMNVQVVLDNPLDGDVLLTHKVISGDIEGGITYRVSNNQIIYNGITYAPGSTFIGVAGVGTYQGTGTVKYDIQKRKLTQDDPYPLSANLASEIVLRVLTKELAIEESKVSDIANDSQDQLKLISQNG